MKTKLMVSLLAAGICAAGLVGFTPKVLADTITYNGTQTAINGTGNTDNGWSVSSSSSLTLATMAQYNYPGYPNNSTDPSDPNNGSGTFLFPVGSKPGSLTRGQFDIWFSVNTMGTSLSGSGLDFYWSVTTTGSGTASGPINLSLYTDSSYGNSLTPNGGGTVGTYASKSGANSLMQNAQDPSWLISGYNPNLDQTLSVDLFAVLAGADPLTAAKVGEITSLVQVGNGGAVPDGGSTIIMLGASLCGLLVIRKRKAIAAVGVFIIALLFGLSPQQAQATPYDLTGTFGGISVVGSGDITAGVLTSGSVTISGAVFNGTFDWAPPTSDRSLDGTDIIFDNLISLSSTPMIDNGGLGFGYDLLSANHYEYVANIWGNGDGSYSLFIAGQMPDGSVHAYNEYDGGTFLATAVPDGGSTCLMLGAGFAGLAITHKRKKGRSTIASSSV